MGQLGEDVCDLGDGQVGQHQAGFFLAQKGDELALGPGLGFDQYLSHLVWIERPEHGLLFVSGQDLQRIGQVFAGQFQGLLAGDRERHDILGVIFN